MSSNGTEVRALVSALAERVVACSDRLSSADIGRALRGFRSLSTDHIEVRKLLRAVMIKVDDSECDLDAHSVELACMGMQRMNSSHHDVRNLLLILEGKISQRMSMEPIKLQPRQACNAIHGLQHMSSEYPEVRRLLGVLVELLEDSSPSTAVRAMREAQGAPSPTIPEQYFTPRAMANALKGLQCMSCAHVDVRDAIRTLAEKLLDDEELLEQFRREPVTIAVALASLKRIQATTMQYSERPSTDREDLGEDVVIEKPSRLGARDRIQEKDRFRSYYEEARAMISLIHPHAVRDVNDSQASSDQWGDMGGDASHLDFDP
mmetsp:Transcript_12560/g.23259  ORF Transcript_12560/g.23259 Transcript_12560/m.23259 type:complete len:320 (+) Transcript_12560:3-962(+)